MRLDELEVREPSTQRVLSAYHDDAITGLMAGLQTPVTRTFAPEQSDVLLLDVTLAPDERVPSRIRLSAPLRGPGLLEQDGQFLVAQRYAIDVVRVVDPLSIFAGDPTRNDSYFLYGAEVIAAAPGRIVASRDGVPENTPPNPPPDVALNDLAGNFVTQDLGGGRFALYAHLQPGSVRVKPGQVVQRGQVLGLVGNSGNSTGPHLHFHVMDGPGGPSQLAANGLPYVFDRFELEGHVTGLESTPPDPIRLPPDPPRRRTGQYPLTGDIIAVP